MKTGNTWVVDADIRSYFDSISHDKMWKTLTGEPYAGDPPVRFGGRGGKSLSYPYLLKWVKDSGQGGMTAIGNKRLTIFLQRLGLMEKFFKRVEISTPGEIISNIIVRGLMKKARVY